MKTPWLKKIDLRKITTKDQNGDDFKYHPDIKTNCQYLIKYGKDWTTGYFNNEWYGYVFDGYVFIIDIDDPDIKGIWQIRAGI